MKSRILIFVAVVLAIMVVACSETDEAKEQKQVVVDAFTKLYNGDVEGYLECVDFGHPLDSAHIAMQKLLLSSYVEEVEARGGISEIEPTGTKFESDTVVYVYYALKYNNGTRESHFQLLEYKEGKWKMKVMLD